MFRRKASRKTNPDRKTLFQHIGLWFYDGIKRSTIIVAVVVVFGAIAYTTLIRREGFPNVASPIGIVTSTHFVNDASKVDVEVAKPINTIILQRSDVKKINSSAGNNFATVQIQFNEGVDAETAMADIQKTIDASPTVPSDSKIQARAFEIDKLTNDGDDLLITITSDGNKNYQELNQVAQQAAEFLQGKVPTAERVHALEMYRQGTDPVTGKIVTEQIAFDQFAQSGTSETTNPQPLVFNSSTIVGVRSNDNADQLEYYDQVEGQLAELSRQPFMQGYRATISADFATSVREQIAGLQKSLLEGIAIVILISFILISFRAGLVTALSMIAVLMTTVGVLFLIGFSLNTITLFALILCLALIVDDTTIMVEALDKGRDEGLPHRTIVANALKRVARASTTGTLVTMLAFAPMLFIGGILGSFIRAIPITIIISLAVSLLVSITFIPLLAHFLLGKPKHGRGFKNPVLRAENWTSNALARVMISTKGSRMAKVFAMMIAITISVLALFGSIFYFSKLDFNIFPETKDSNEIMVQVVTPPNSSLQSVQETANQVNSITADSLAGEAEEASYTLSGSKTGFSMTVKLTPYKTRELTSIQIADQLKQDLRVVKNAQIEVAQVGVGPPNSAFSVRIFDEDPEKARRLAADVEAYMKTATLVRPDGSTTTFKNPMLSSSTEIDRAGNERYVEVTAGFYDKDVSALVALGQESVEKAFPAERVTSYGLPANALRFELGQEQENQDSFKAMLLAFPILLLVMYVLLAVQFKSFLQPFLIFSALPFSLLGVAVGLYLTDNPLSFFTMIGFFALIGISMNNTILLTDYANQARARGERPLDSMASALHVRFRPLITTSTTSVLALLPLALADPFWESLAYTLIFGLISSTILVILIFPYFYLFFEWLRGFGHSLAQKVRRKK